MTSVEPTGPACRLPHLRLPPVEHLDDRLASRVAAGTDERWVRQMGHAAEAFDKWLDAYFTLLRSKVVPARTKELCRLRIAALNSCQYCATVRLERRSGEAVVDDATARAVLDGALDDLELDPAERVAVRYAEQMWHDHHGVDDQLWRDLMACYPPEAFMELALLVSQFTAIGQLNAMLGIPAPGH